jgi:hypothetical protein
MNSKQREALEAVYECAMDGVLTIRESAFEKVASALTEPLRNCDVGTADEQYARFVDFCWRYRTVSVGGNSSCNDCPIKGRKVCQLAWAQMPYESEVNHDRQNSHNDEH